MYYLNEDDKEQLGRVLRRYDRELNTPFDRETDQFVPTSDVYVVVPPCGLNIPARIGAYPGQRECCLFRIKEVTADSWQLVSVMEACPWAPYSTQTRIDVYNIYDTEWPALQPPNEKYIVVRKEKYGRWLCDEPPGQLTTAATQTTSTTTTTLHPCGGSCKYIWNAGQNAWILSSDGCTNNPTTTTSSTTTTQPADGCICPQTTTTTTTSTTSTSTTTTTVEGETTTTTTTTSTTTTTDDCNCIYPPFCGTNDGECTWVSCVAGQSEVPHDCTTTTTSTSTTTCDCNTTTTKPGCSGGCNYVWSPNQFWIQTSNECTAECPCATPNSAGIVGGLCEPQFMPCVVPGDVLSCGGLCQYWWVPAIAQWVLTESWCGPGPGCFCSEPSIAGNICAPINVPCQSVIIPPILPNSCEACYTSTTSSTTTTVGDCPGNCKWHWDNITFLWVRDSSECVPPCNCVRPAYDGQNQFGCNEVAWTPCFYFPTTTTTTTTTTSTTTTTCADSGTKLSIAVGPTQLWSGCMREQFGGSGHNSAPLQAYIPYNCAGDPDDMIQVPTRM